MHSGRLGNKQWAFTPGLSSRDLVTALVMSSILAFATGKKIAAYLGDISGAFDKVFSPYLLAKLHAFGVGSLFLNFFSSYLQPRRAQVVVEGVCSDPFEILDTVFQGTVLGPPLWNVFFNDVIVPAGSTGGDPNLFADDLNVFQKIDRLDDNDAIKLEMDRCRSEVHSWGNVIE